MLLVLVLAPTRHYIHHYITTSNTYPSNTACNQEDLKALLSYTREWNTNSRTCHVAQTLLRVVLTTVPLQRLVQLPGAEDILTGLLAYSQRHYARMERLQRSACVLDYMVGAMGVLDAQEETQEDVGGGGEKGSGTPEPREGGVVAVSPPGDAEEGEDQGAEEEDPARKSRKKTVEKNKKKKSKKAAVAV